MPLRRKRWDPARLITLLESDNPEYRWDAANELAERGDRSAILPLERVALNDDGYFLREGGFVDHLERPASAAIRALEAVYRRHPPTPEDIARARQLLVDPGPAERAQRSEAIAAALGAAAAEVARPLLEHPDPMVRLRAYNVLDRIERANKHRALWVEDDEDVRLAATRQTPDRYGLVKDALERLPAEPSVRVRRGICDLWLRGRDRIVGQLLTTGLARFLADDDSEIRVRVARHLVDVAQRGPSWLYDTSSLVPTCERLAELVARETDPEAATIQRKALALLEEAVQPYRRSR